MPREIFVFNLNLIGGEDNPPPFLHPLGSPLIAQKPSHFVAFSNVLLETCVPNLVSLSCPSLQILGKTRTGVYRISDQSLIKQNCHNCRTSADIDMKLGTVTKFDNGNKTTSIKFDNDVISGNCDVIVIFLIYGQFGAIQKPDSGHIACKTYIFIKINLLFYKN